MATLLLDVTTFPQTFTSGTFPLSTLNDGDWRITFTFTNAVSSFVTGGNYFALVVCNDLGGLWIFDDGGTKRIALFQNVSGSPVIVQSSGIVASAGSSITVHVKNTTDEMILTGSAGFTSGAGTYAFAGSTTGDAFGTAPLGVGAYGGGGYTWSGSASDIDDGVDAIVRTAAGVTALGAATVATRALARSAAGVSALGAAAAAARELARQAAGITAIGVATAADVAGEIVRTAAGVTGLGVATAATRALSRQAAGASALGAATAAARQLSRTAAGATAINVSTAATVAGEGIQLGGYGAARVLYGTSAGTVSVTITTEASGSTFLLAVGGNLSDLATAPTDTEGNTWVEVGSFEFSQWAGYGCVYYQAVNGTGAGGSHTFSQQYGQTLGFDECTIAVVEIRNAIHVEDFASGESASGSTVNTPSVTSQDACEWVVFSTGDAPTGSTAAYSPSNGLTVIHDTTGVDHPNGYVPIILLHASKASAGTYTSAIGITPAQRLGLGVFAVQAANVIVRQAAGVTGIGAATAATRALNRQAEGATAIGAATAALRALQRTAAGVSAIDVATAATHEAAGTHVRSAAGVTGIGVATAAARSVVRAAAGVTVLGAAVAAVRALVRQASGVTAIGAATAATTGTSALPRTFTVTVGVAAAADFTVEVDP